ncbi:probable Methylthioribose-1-phosphate isomerase [Zygosaccharomyces bailii]|nr:probable Methylthioribose-1-phosphate isomerase [Zygosaccharomyces bailii]
MSLEAIKFDRSTPHKVSVKVLDQLLLPYTTKYVFVHTIDDGYRVIKNMQVRGAPAIAIVGSLSILTEVQFLQLDSQKDTQWFYDLTDWYNVKGRLFERIEFLLSSRPTAVNLANSLATVRELLEESNSLPEFDLKLFQYVCKLIDDDLANNITMGNNGAEYLLDALSNDGFHGEFGVLTICNTGSLATSGYGTALGVVRSLWAKSQSIDSNQAKKQKTGIDRTKMVEVFPLETRPYNQGSRLTAYELVHDGIPTTLITDSMIAYKIKTSPIPIKAAFVGADRIVRNGDTANKIGTFQLAIICRQFGVKFFVVAPKTTIDNVSATGDSIVVEERNPNEFRLVAGTALDPCTEKPLLNSSQEPQSAKVGIAPPTVKVWNPAFDVTPHELIDGIVTEQGVFTKDSRGEFNLDKLF